MTTINQVQFPKVFIVGPSGFVADVNSSGQLLTSGSGGGGGGTIGQAVVAYVAAPAFPASATVGSFKITLTGNVTSSTLTGATAGQLIVFEIIQDATGGRTFVWPTNVKNAMSITGQAAGANEVSTQMFYYDGTNAYAVGPGLVSP